MKKIIFVCTGNICRSPTAEGVMARLIKQHQLEHLFELDSAGIMGHHQGEAPDHRTQRFAQKRGYDLSGLRARKLLPQDYREFDYLLAMDEGHLEFMLENCPPELKAKKHISLFLDFSLRWRGQAVPDPYYQGAEAFELVLDQVEEACTHLLEHMKQELK